MRFCSRSLLRMKGEDELQVLDSGMCKEKRNWRSEAAQLSKLHCHC